MILMCNVKYIINVMKYYIIIDINDIILLLM